MVDLQYQALRKCVSAVRGVRKELVSEIAGVGSPKMAIDAAQARLLGKMMRDQMALGDMWKGQGTAMSSLGTRPSERAMRGGEEANWEDGRSWKGCSQHWNQGKDDGFTSVDLMPSL